MKTRVIVFDLDDTLYPEREYVRSGLQAACQFAETELGLPGLYAAANRLFDAGCRGTVFQEALRSSGYEDVEGSHIAAMVEAYRQHIPRLNLFPDVAEVLPRLPRFGRLAIVTDGYLPPQRHKVQALGLESTFDPVVYTESLGRDCWKPSPEGFLKVESTCRVTPDVCVYVADNPRKDFSAPRSRGWKTVRIRRPDTEHGDVEEGVAAHLEMNDFFELERWLTSGGRLPQGLGA